MEFVFDAEEKGGIEDEKRIPRATGAKTLQGVCIFCGPNPKMCEVILKVV